MRDRVTVLRTMVENLLEISRLDAGCRTGRAATRPATRPGQGNLEHTGLAAEVTVRQSGTVTTDPRRLDRILTNLLTNAHRHGHPPVLITLDQDTITIRDHGPGFPAELLTHGPQRFQTATPNAATATAWA